MATQRPISTISYNSESFLVEKLNALVSAHTLQSYVYIKHTGEDGDKDHIHLLVFPNKRIDPMDLSDHLKEFVQGSAKPLGVLNWHTSKESDWFLYAIHNADYLASHSEFEKEKIPYCEDDFVYSEGFLLHESLARALASLKHSTASIVQSLRSGVDPVSLIEVGSNPFLVNNVFRLLSSSDFSDLKHQVDFYRSVVNQMNELFFRLGYEVNIDSITGKVDIFRRYVDE